MAACALNSARALCLVVLVALSCFLVGVSAQNVTIISLPAVECKRFTTAQGTFGCQSPKVAGPLWGVYTQADLEDFLARASRAEKWIVALPPILFNQTILEKLKTGPLGGLLIGSTKPNVSYSTETKCPNCQWGLYANQTNYSWNPAGNGLTYESFNIPIYLLSSSLDDYVKQLAQYNIDVGQNYTNFPLAGLEMSAFQFANVNSQKCLTRGFCDPVFGSSVWSTYTPLLKANDERKLFMITSQMDSFGLFTDSANGAYSRMTGMVAVIAVAEALQRLANPASFKHHIAFALFNADAVGFGGSSRFYKDIFTTFECEIRGVNFCNRPYYSTLNFTQLNTTRLAGTIHLDSLGNGQLFAHIEDRVSGNPSNKTLDLLSTLLGINPNVSRASASTTNTPKGVPPTSVMSLLSRIPDSPVLVLSDYDETFSSIYHGTWLDDQDALPLNSTEHICAAAATVVRTIWRLANETEPPQTVQVDCDMVAKLMYCFSYNLGCDYLTTFVNVTEGSFGTSSYTNVPGFNGLTKYSQLIAYVLANFSAPEFGQYCDGNVYGFCTNNTEETGLWNCIGYRCARNTAFLHPAWDLGLEFDYNKRNYYVADHSKPALCESRFSTITLNAGLVNATGQEIGMLIGAILASVIVWGATFFSSRYIQTHFKQD